MKGAFFMTQTFENASVVDLSPPQSRGAALAVNGAMLGLGLITGSLISVGLGTLMKHAAPYLVASICHFLCWLLCFGSKKRFQ